MNSFCRITFVLGLVVVLAQVGPGFSVFASDTDVASLRGLQGVKVAVEISGAEIKGPGLSGDELRADVELRLGIARIGVLSEEEVSKVLGRPLLHVSVNVLRLDATKGYFCFISIELRQGVYLKRDPKIRKLVATTWSQRTVVVVPDAGAVQAKVRDLVGDFVNAYISVAPQKQINTGIRG